MTHKHPQKRSSAKYDGRAKIITSATALVALLGGWNAIGHLESSAQAAPADASGAAVANQQQVENAATLKSLGITPLAALPAIPQALAPGNVSTTESPPQVGQALQLSDLHALQALPEIPALPAQQLVPLVNSGRRSGGS